MPLLSKMGALPSRISFPLFLIGGLLGLIGLVTALIALYTTRPAKGRAGRGLAWSALGLCAAVLAGIAFAASSGRSAPPINDITTDFTDPPQFSSPDKSYPGESFAVIQRKFYTDLAPIIVNTPPEQTFAAVKSAIENFGWEIVAADASTGMIEATDTTKLFRFVDDVVVRIRPQATGSRVDVRSKSREGRGDLGVNAARIRRLRDALRAEPGA
jgi:uncharacterized protein (DUF1499 family)